MPPLWKLLSPLVYARNLWRILAKCLAPIDPNLRGVLCFPPGHFYSPLLDLTEFPPNLRMTPFDGPDYWECIDLRPDEQRAYFVELIANPSRPPFPETKTDGFRYYTNNAWFPFSDAFTLSGIIQKEKPRRIVEVGSGFSTAVMIDTINHDPLPTTITCIEPYPDRLHSVLLPTDGSVVRIIQSAVQSVPLSTFEDLQAGDLLFIDSSHVAKVGSDVTHLLLRVLPRLKAGVIVHVHDVFYPESYPAEWLREGRAWNETLFLRAFLANNASYQILAFNAFACHHFPEVFRRDLPSFIATCGGSLWFRKVANGANTWA